jgi:tryptophan synthase alpha chain
VNRIEVIFAHLRRERRSALMPFITAGFPSLDVTMNAISAMEAAGAKIMELGIPFSDPIADGPVIAAAMHDALQRGVTPATVFEAVKLVRRKTAAGLVAMVSDSIVQRMGPPAFIRRAADAGFDGLIVPDIDMRDAAEVSRLAHDAELTFTMLIAPTTQPIRITAITRLCTGFVYVLARTGITGERDAAPEVAARVEQVRQHTDLPIAVGFGISTPAHVAAVTRPADGRGGGPSPGCSRIHRRACRVAAIHLNYKCSSNLRRLGSQIRYNDGERMANADPRVAAVTGHRQPP